MKKNRIRHSKQQQQQQKQSLESLVQHVQKMECLDKDDVVDERAGLYKFTVCYYGYNMD